MSKELILADKPMTNERYEEFVQEQFSDAARVRQRIVFTNRGAFHAHAVMSQMLARCERSVDIVSGCLRDIVFDAELLRTISSKVVLRLIVTDEIPLRAPSALAHLKQEIENGKVSVRHPRSAVPVPHFAIADGRHLRSEKDRVENTAVIVLNADLPEADDLAAGYVRFFEHVWDGSDPIDFASLLAR